MIGLRFDDGGLAVNLAQAPQIIGLQLQQWMQRVLQHLHSAAARNMEGGLIGRRTGTLIRALRELITVTPDGVVGELWPDPDKSPYGAIQEFGGTVLPKHGQFLTIPLDAMLTPNGVARGRAGQLRDEPQAFGFSSTFVQESKAGNLLIFGKRAASKDVIPLFALKSSVVIPARAYLGTTLMQEWAWISDELERLTGDFVKVTFGAAA